MSTKLGSKNIILPYSKAYLGSNLVYQKSGGYEDIEFTSCPFPTSWTDVGTEYLGINDYGRWIVYADSASSKSYNVSYAFDGNYNTRYASGKYNLSEYEEMKIVLPDKVSIKPTQIYLCASYIGNSISSAKIQGLISGEWETIVDDVVISSNDQITYPISTDKFYSQFRLYFTNNTTKYAKTVYEFQITSGTLRKEN